MKVKKKSFRPPKLRNLTILSGPGPRKAQDTQVTQKSNIFRPERPRIQRDQNPKDQETKGPRSRTQQIFKRLIGWTKEPKEGPGPLRIVRFINFVYWKWFFGYFYNVKKLRDTLTIFRFPLTCIWAGMRHQMGWISIMGALEGCWMALSGVTTKVEIENMLKS